MSIQARRSTPLTSASIVNQFCHSLSDLSLDLGDVFRVIQFDQRFIVLYIGVDIIDMHKCVTVNPWHVSIDLSEDSLRIAYRCRSHFHGDAQRTEAVLIGRGNLNEGGIQR